MLSGDMSEPETPESRPRQFSRGESFSLDGNCERQASSHELPSAPGTPESRTVQLDPAASPEAET